MKRAISTSTTPTASRWPTCRRTGCISSAPASRRMSDSDEKMSPEAWAKSIPLYCDEHLRQLEENAKQLYENTEYSIQGGFVLAGLGSNGIFAGHTISDWLCRLVTEPDYAFSILQATAERAVENLTRLSCRRSENTSTRFSCPAPISARRRANSSARGSSRNSTSPTSS